ncbi:Uncharacterised protein [Nocardia farcinica]|uniref:DUF3037 domain-containing protein n=1 Tax=Nocardia farcinica TaxID=37329 RepID=A0A449G730_NOCFR|nr:MULTISPECIES: hypothetical protein [Nocardia]PEH79589.1 hypothetical protein CRM89_29465 [Nocardia sp. FDAARGOS_372]VFA94732.1 Uncharacterised protein [Nocardia farcinica]
MNATWHLIQYTADMRRKEPRNIGVAAFVDGMWAVKFFAVDAQGQINGRALRRFGVSKEGYADWVEYYTYMIEYKSDPDQVLRVQQKRPSEFRMVTGGLTQVQCSANEFAEQLFVELVAGDDSPTAEPWAKLLKQRVETVLKVAEVHPQPDVEVPAVWGPQVAADDAVRFDYRYTNGQVHLMDRLQFHRVTVDSAKSVAREFHARVAAARAAGASESFIAFYSGEAVEAMNSDSMLSPIFNHAKIVDVDEPERAAGQLRHFVHLSA